METQVALGYHCIRNMVLLLPQIAFSVLEPTSIGPVVRIQPNEVSIAYPEAISTIYGAHTEFLKVRKSACFQTAWLNDKQTDFYDAFQSHMCMDGSLLQSFGTIAHVVSAKYNDTFSERDETIHAHRRKIVNGLYTQNSILEFEPRFNVLIDIFCERMADFADSGQEFDMSTWISRFDSISLSIHQASDGRLDTHSM